MLATPLALLLVGLIISAFVVLHHSIGYKYRITEENIAWCICVLMTRRLVTPLSPSMTSR